MDQQKIKEAADYFRGREHETLDRAKSTKHLRVLVAAAESLLAGVPMSYQWRDGIGEKNHFNIELGEWRLIT